MAWSGPAAGTAPYQPPQYANGQPPYQQPPYSQQPQQYPQQPYGQQSPYGQQPYQQPPYGQSQYPQGAPPQQGQPPSQPPYQKRKGNPIITRYPPPPGYRGPAQNQGPPYGQNQYPPPQGGYQPPPQGGYQQGYQQPPNYQQNQGYQQPQSYPPQQGPYRPPPNYQQSGGYQQLPQNYQQGYPQPSYPPNQGGYQQPQGYQQPPQGYPPQQASYQGYPPQSGQPPQGPPDPNAPPYPQSGQPWQPPNQQPPYPPNDQYGPYGPQPPPSTQDPNATPIPTPAQPHTDQTTPIQGQPSSAVSMNPDPANGSKPGELYLAWDDWDFDFDGAIWPKGNEPIDPNLSLGVILWRPAKQVTRALPSTYAEAEEQALRPPAEKLGNGESVSIYFTLENSHEAFLNVRQTDDWPNVMDDPIFVEFPDINVELISLEDVVANRDRPDWSVEEVVQDREDREITDSNWNVMDNLEQALTSGQHSANEPESDARDKSDSPHAQPSAAKDQSQEDILAQLGVTGSPKPVFPTPGPAYMPPQPVEEPMKTPDKPPRPYGDKGPPRSNSYSGYRSSSYGQPPQRGYGSMPSHHSHPPLLPESENSPSHDPWKVDQPLNRANGHASYDGTRDSPARSEGSNRTLAGSDFEMENKTNATNGADKIGPPEPRLQRTESSASRKRSYDETDQEDGKLRQSDDYTPRLKRRQPQVAAAYSRR